MFLFPVHVIRAGLQLVHVCLIQEILPAYLYTFGGIQDYIIGLFLGSV